MSDGKKTFFGILGKLVPTKTAKVDVSPEEIDKVPVPKFPTERAVETKIPTDSLSSSGPATTSISQPALPGSSAPPKTENVTVIKTVSLSTPTLQITNRFGGGIEETDYVSKDGVLIGSMTKAVKEAAHVPRSVPFEPFNRSHLEACKGLMDVLYYINSENLETAISYALPLVNEELLNYCVSVIARHRLDFQTENIQLPSHITMHPSIYVDVSKVEPILFTREVTHTNKNQSVEIESVHDFTATDKEPEHFVAYFREDIGVNLHHRHWHEVYPTVGPKPVVNLDRRGELFVYMHGQILARYNFERLCNGLEPVKKFSNFKEPIMEAYYPKLDEASELKVWSPRQPYAQLRDVTRDGILCEVADLERWQERIIATIDRGYALKKLDDGSEIKIKLEEPDAINDLGNTIDAVENLSYNYGFYGDLHTSGHILVAYCHDPDKRFKEPGSVMGRLEAALRDPIFYRWHAFVDDIMDRYKKTLNQYTIEQRLFEGVEVDSVEIDSGVEDKNCIRTFWQKDRVDVTDGILSLQEMELKKRPDKVYVKFTHLQHKDFTYKFRVYNWRTKPTVGTVRIFMAPLKDETRQEMQFNKLRRFMIELDKFTITLRKGKNEFTRKSTCSSVTVPFEQTFMTKEEAVLYTTDEQKRQKILSYCGCGWPHHMLIGRGREIGYPCTLFVMITDYEEDKVADSSIESCGTSSISYCGVRNKLYPDKRPMGFPFDRPIKDESANLDTFMTKSQRTNDKNPEKVRNMYKTIIQIKYHNEVVLGPTCGECKTETH